MHQWFPYIAPFILLAILLALFIGIGFLTGESKDRPMFSYERRRIIDQANEFMMKAEGAPAGEAASLYQSAFARAERAANPLLCSEALVGLAYVRVKQGRHAEAVPLYERALTYSPQWQGHSPNYVLLIERELRDARAKANAGTDRPDSQG